MRHRTATVRASPQAEAASPPAQGLPMDCAMAQALDLVANKWTAPIMWCLTRAQGGPVRFRELQRMIGSVTQKELTKRLRELERAGILSRTVHPEVPPRVEYAITEFGQTLVGPLAGLAIWADTHGKQLEENRQRYDARPKARASAAED